MKKIKIICMLIISIMIGASAVGSVSASEIDEGNINVTINDNVYGTVSPEIDINDGSSVTLKADKLEGENETTYLVNDTLSIPINIIEEKEKIYSSKFLFGRISLTRKPYPKTFKDSAAIICKEGSLFNLNILSEIMKQYLGMESDFEARDNISVKVQYEISEEQFLNGENMSLGLRLMGGVAPGQTEDFEMTLVLDSMLEKLKEEDGLMVQIKVKILETIQELIDASGSFKIKTFILACKDVDLNVNYELGGQVEPPTGWKLDVDVPEGNGSVIISPNQNVYEDDTTVKITAVPEDGYVFHEWSGDLTGTENPANITMNENKTVSAHFVQSPVSVQAKSWGIGSTTLTVTNQREYNLSDVEYNLTISGGLLGKISGQTNGTVDNVTAGGNIELTTPSVMLGLGKSTITLELVIPGEGEMEKQYSAMHIGPIMLSVKEI